MTDTCPASCVPLLRANAARIVAMRAARAGWKAIAAEIGFRGPPATLRAAWMRHFAHLSPRRRMVVDLRDEMMAMRAAGDAWSVIAARFDIGNVASLINAASRLGWTKR